MSSLYAMAGNEAFATLLSRHSGLPCRVVQQHRFPDGESLVRVEPPPPLSTAVVVCTLDHPDPKLVPLLMAAATLRELGASRVGLVAPYLAYMRQDARFHEGEAVSARVFGSLLGHAFNWVITADPHLHRYRQLGDIYPLEGSVVHAAPRVANWIAANVTRPMIIGPDGESAQWVNAVARMLDAPSVLASKERLGDREVRISLPSISRWPSHTPVILDDIISSGHTLIDTVHGVKRQTSLKPVCIGLHGIFSAEVFEALLAAGASDVITSNSIVSEHSRIDISADVARMILDRCGERRSPDRSRAPESSG